MKFTWALGAAAIAAAGGATAQPSVPVIGPDAAYCAPGAKDPAALVEVSGLKDRTGDIRIELYPDNDADFLGDRHKLVDEGKAFRRVITTLPEAGPVSICIKTPGPGRFALAIIHQRGTTRSFTLNKDGIGFPNNPRLFFSKPDVNKVAMSFASGVTVIPVTMNYKQGLSMKPLPVK